MVDGVRRVEHRLENAPPSVDEPVQKRLLLADFRN